MPGREITPCRGGANRRPVIVIVLNSLIAEGTQRMALALARHWLAQGVCPVVLVLDHTRDEIGHSFSALGIKIIGMPARPSGKLRYLGLVWATYLTVRRLRAQAVLSMPFGWHAFIALGAKLAGADRAVAHVGNHPGGLSRVMRQKMAMLVRIGWPFTDRLACCSDYVRRGVIELLPVSERVTKTIYNGIEIDSLSQKARPHQASRGVGRINVVMVARFETHKDQPTLIRTAALLRARGIDMGLCLIGEGSRRAEFEKLARELRVADHVHFLGFRDDIPELLGASDVFAFATTPDEGLGIALIEAMAARTPIVASDVGACRETLAGGTCGLLVSPQDPEAMAEGILRIGREPEATTERVEQADRRARELFNSATMAKSYLDLLLR